MPWEYFTKHVILATNKALTDNGIKQELTLGELKQWMGILFLMSLHPQFSTDKFFCTNTNTKGSKKRKRNDFWDPPCCGKYMSGKRFGVILSNLWLCNDLPPTYRDRSWRIYPLVNAFNKQMTENFNWSWLSCLDESMVAFLNEHCPNWVCVKRKPNLFGNRYHTIVCCLSKIIYQMELVETDKDHPKEGDYSKPKFEDVMPKTAAL